MSLSLGGYPEGYTHPGPMGIPHPHEFYHQYQQVRYPDNIYNDRAYFHNWILSGTPEIPTSPESYATTGTPSPPNYDMTQYEAYTNQFGERCYKRRTNANKKERRRTLSINTAFSNLRGCIPNVPSDTKLSKIKTLRLAISYISYLTDVLEKDDPTLSEAGFKAELSRKRERRTEEKKPETISTSDSDDSSSGERKKGRTGWPQTVWASELKTQ